MQQLQKQLIEEIRDLYDAEKQLVKALPKMAKAVSTSELKQAFLEHLEVTKGQVTRLEQVFENLGERAKSKPCKAMKGLVEEAQEHIQEMERGQLLDNMLITAAQKVEHYEIAGYGTVRSIAKTLGKKEVMSLLQETLKEEETCDKNLTQIALRLQKELMRPQPETGDDKKAASGSKKKVAAKKQGGTGGASSNGGNVSTDHDFIRQWAEERDAHPACVRGTGGKSDKGIIRLDFPGYTGADKLEEISWDEWFGKFDEQGLALVYQETTSGGQKSNFNKLISRQTAKK